MVKKLLDELRWHPKKSLKGVEITYIHRGAPGDRITIPAEHITAFEKSFFRIMKDERETMIPYHRISEVRKGGKVLWRKRTGG
jgi:uncharacterized protein (UPF0248 family)